MTLSACGGGGGGGAPSSRWRVQFSGLAPAVLSVGGTSEDDVWMVGSDPSDGKGPLLLRYDGTDFRRIPTAVTGAADALWWVMVEGQERVWMAGDGGQILRYDRSTQQLDRMLAPSNETLYGVHAFSGTNVWAVGGNPGQTTGVIWRYDGNQWAAPSDLPAGLDSGIRFFKVFGLSANDVWFVGVGGAALRYQNGTTWTRVTLPVSRPLFTVHGNSFALMAVGGQVSGYLVEKSGNNLADATPSGAPQLNGIFLTEVGDAVAVGIGGAVWRRDLLGGGSQGSSEWTADPTAPSLSQDYHAVYVDPTGGIWAVGGDIATTPLGNGVISHWGDPISADAIIDP